RSLERRAPRVPPLVELRADPLDARDHVPPDLVHHVVAEALEQAHHRLRLPEQAALLVGHEPLDPVLRRVLPGLAAERSAERLQCLLAQAARLAAEEPELALEPVREVRPEPG